MEKDSDRDYWVKVQRSAELRLKDCRLRLNALDIRRADLTNEILQLEKVIQTVASLPPDRVVDVGGKINQIAKSFASSTLADACRKILQVDERHLTPVEVRNILQVGNYDLSQHPNPLASIHGVLKRLVQSGEAQQIGAQGKTFYRSASRLGTKRKKSGARK